jgi:putative transposase
MKRNEPILQVIQCIKAEHPLWGYRRVWAYMKYRLGYPVNKKRIYRLMKEADLLVTQANRNKAKRIVSRPKPQAQYPNHIWGTDMTKIKLSTYGWIYIHIILDWYTKEIIGYSLSSQSKTADWLDALHMAVNQRFPQGIHETEHPRVFLVSDNGCQPTSLRYMEECSILKIKQIFTSWSNPKGNAETERVFRTIKEDLVWTHDWDDPFAFQRAFETWIYNYNNDFPHQSLANKTPAEFHQMSVSNKEPVLT